MEIKDKEKKVPKRDGSLRSRLSFRGSLPISVGLAKGPCVGILVALYRREKALIPNKNVEYNANLGVTSFLSLSPYWRFEKGPEA